MCWLMMTLMSILLCMRSTLGSMIFTPLEMQRCWGPLVLCICRFYIHCLNCI
ncbi:unnamed protein product, partial [Linum tenue]